MQRPKIERADQLPTHTYSVPGSVVALLGNERLMREFRDHLATDLKMDLESFDIQDKATLRSYYTVLSRISFANRDFDGSLEYISTVRAMQEKPAAVEVSGMVTESLVSAAKSDRDPMGAFSSHLRERLRETHYDIVQTELKAMKGQFEMITENIMMGIVAEQMEPPAKGGSVSKELAMGLVEIEFVVKGEIPYKEAIVECLKEVIDSHAIVKEDIWAPRYVDLTEEEGLTPVNVAVWDTGVDVSLFNGLVWTDPSSVRERYGLSWTYDGTRTFGPLRVLEGATEKMEIGRRHSKGFFDMQYQIESPESEEVKRKLSTLGQNEVKEFLEPILMYTTYGHGTHVAGLVASGNPGVRLVTIRFEVPYTLAPAKVSLEWGRAQAAEMVESVHYLQDHGVKVVNMSWGFNPSEFEHSLEYYQTGKDAEERRRVAREIFDEFKAPFKEAIEGAVGTLFVAACGNENVDARFEEFVPASFDMPNVITVGAVDLAGDEAAFTSYGSAVVYANGYQVESLVPGGGRESWSGTSMAAPQVTNLAAKLLAKYPNLSPVQVKKLILDGSDEKQVGSGRTIKLMNEKRSMEAASALMQPSGGR